MNTSRLLGWGLIATVLLAGCSSKEKTATSEKLSAKPQEEYVRYTPTGSWVSKKVPKSQVKASDTESAQAQQAMGDLQRIANDHPKDPEVSGRNPTGRN